MDGKEKNDSYATYKNNFLESFDPYATYKNNSSNPYATYKNISSESFSKIPPLALTPNNAQVVLQLLGKKIEENSQLKNKMEEMKGHQVYLDSQITISNNVNLSELIYFINDCRKSILHNLDEIMHLKKIFKYLYNDEINKNNCILFVRETVDNALQELNKIKNKVDFESTLSSIRNVLSEHTKIIGELQETINKQNKLLDKYRKIKDEYLEMKKSKEQE